jgi:hypothetical protein
MNFFLFVRISVLCIYIKKKTSQGVTNYNQKTIDTFFVLLFYVLFLKGDTHIQGVLKMVHNIYVTRIYVEYQRKNSNVNILKIIIIIKIDKNENPCYFLTLLKFENSL